MKGAYGEAPDIITMTGLGRTLADGHRHTADWSPASIDERVANVREGAGDRDLVLDALVQHSEITDDRAGAAERVASAVPGLTTFRRWRRRTRSAGRSTRSSTNSTAIANGGASRPTSSGPTRSPRSSWWC